MPGSLRDLFPPFLLSLPCASAAQLTTLHTCFLGSKRQNGKKYCEMISFSLKQPIAMSEDAQAGRTHVARI